MWYCQECDNIFEEPYLYREDPSPKGICLPPGEEIWCLCPICGSSYVEELEDEDDYDEDDLWFEGN